MRVFELPAYIDEVREAMSVQRRQRSLVLHDSQDNQKLEDILLQVLSVLQTIRQTGKDLYKWLHLNFVQIRGSLLPDHIGLHYIPGPWLLPEVKAGWPDWRLLTIFNEKDLLGDTCASVLDFADYILLVFLLQVHSGLPES